MMMRALLTGGDRRSLARAAEALDWARQDEQALGELAQLTSDADPLVAYRALDVLEKLAHEDPASVDGARHTFVEHLGDSHWEARLQCVRAVALFDWGTAERANVIDALRARLDDDQKFVRAWALDSFATLAGEDPTLRQELDGRIAEFLGSDSKALQARAKAVAKRLDSG